MLVHQACHDEIVDAAVEARSGDIALSKSLVDSPLARDRQHLRRQVDSIDACNTTISEPCSGPAGAAPEVGCPREAGPWKQLQGIEQNEIHLVLNPCLIG